MEQDDEAYMKRRRERLDEERAALWDQQAEVERKLEALNRELAAMTAYENVLQGKPAQPVQPPGGERAAEPPRTAGRRAPRGSGAGKREEILGHVRAAARDGITSSDLNGLLNPSGDLAARQSIANALAALKKDGLIRQDGKRSPYFATDDLSDGEGEGDAPTPP